MRKWRKNNLESERERERIRGRYRRQTEEYKEYHSDYAFKTQGVNRISGYFVECNNCGKVIKKPLCRIMRHQHITCSKKCGNEVRDNIPWNKGMRTVTKPEDRNYLRHREYGLYKDWHMTCLKRDWFKCQICDSKERIEVHHIKSYKEHPEERVNADNGITLCKPCHLWVHNFDVLAQQ